MLPNEKQTASLTSAADRDIAALDKFGDDPVIADEIWGFHAQQPTEELLKSLLIRENIRYPFAHNLELIAEVMRENNLPIPTCAEALLVLTPFAVELRYAANSFPHPPLDRPAMLREVKAFRQYVRQATSL